MRFSLSGEGGLKASGENATIQKWAPQIRQHKGELTDLLREWESLRTAINACCAARGDTDEHRMALLADCLWEEPSDWGWWLHYFKGEESKTLNNPTGRINGEEM